MGMHIYRVLHPKEKTFLDPVFGPVERFIYRTCKIDPLAEQGWKEYLTSVLGFSLVAVIVTFILLAMQRYLPLNPQKLHGVAWDLNTNTSISFLTNTNWQNYGGEAVMSYFSQMAALTVQNFASPAVGLAVAATLVRGLARAASETIGNFWTDFIRICLYLLLPIAIVGAMLFMAEGVPQNFKSYVQAKTLDGGMQTIAQGPIASQESIKILGTNGGGFMNVNSAHPYENPTPYSNLLQLVLILLIPAGSIYYFGKAVGNIRHAWCIFAAVAAVLVAGIFICAFSESAGNPHWKELGLSGGNWEGKEQRFGIFASALYACTTTVTSCGAVNCMHDSLTPIAGLIPLLNIELGEVIFGGVGAGLYGILLFVILSVFIAGLVIGRTPEYLGKKIEAFDIKMTMLAILPMVLTIIGFTAWCCISAWGLKGLANQGPHGFSEMLYSYSSCVGNNGSAFAGLSGNTVPYNLTQAIAMIFGRFLMIIPVIALAGSMAEKKMHPKNAGTFPVSSPIFISLLIGVIFLIGALTFLPALTLGPIVEHFLFLKGQLF